MDNKLLNILAIGIVQFRVKYDINEKKILNPSNW